MKYFYMKSAPALFSLGLLSLALNAAHAATTIAPASTQAPADSKTGSSVTTIPNSDTNYQGDHLQSVLPDTPAYAVQPDKSTGQNPTLDGKCLPEHATLRGVSSAIASLNSKDGSTSTPVSGAIFQIDKDITHTSSACIADWKKGDEVFIDQTTLTTDGNFMRWGWAYGGLGVPFKYELTGTRDLETSGTAAPYLGYRFSDLNEVGTTFTPVIFAGASTINVPSTTSGSTSTTNKTNTAAGFSYGTGLLFTIKSSLTLGVVVGFDHVDRSQNYEYNDKPWIAFSIGYAFEQ